MASCPGNQNLGQQHVNTDIDLPAGLPDLPDLPDLPAPMATAPPPTASPKDAGPAHLTQPQKAAVIVRLLFSAGIKLSIADLPEDVQCELALQVGALQRVDGETVEAVINEFASELNKGGLGTSGGLEKALEMLEGSMSTSIANKLRKQAGIGIIGDPWEKVAEIEAERLAEVMSAESPEVSAVILSKLKVDKAAEILGLMPGAQARRITYAVSRTSGVLPDAVMRIGRALVSQMSIQPVVAFSNGPVERVGAILNFSRAMTRNDVLEGLDESDKAFAEEVRRYIFTFANIPHRIDARDIPKIVRQVDQAVLTKALAASKDTDPEVGEFIFAGMSQRMVQAIQGEIEEVENLSEEDGEAAMGEVVAAIRQLEEDGEIFLVTQQEE